MLDFKVPAIEDKDWAEPILKSSGCFGADCAFGTLFIWSDAYDTKICRYENFLIKLHGKDQKYYSFPVGNGDLKTALTLIGQDASERGIPLQFAGLTQKMMEKIEEFMPDKFSYHPVREIADYIYNVSDLSELCGKKYHSKRNHISKFDRLYEWAYEEISQETIASCKEFINVWFNENSQAKEEGIEKERAAIEKAFSNYDELGFKGGMIKVSGEIAALTIGEEINSQVFLTHFEKALLSYTGAYTIVNREFAKESLSSYQYVNREEDMGIEGLRKAKMSYHPVILLEKYSAVSKE